MGGAGSFSGGVLGQKRESSRWGAGAIFSGVNTPASSGGAAGGSDSGSVVVREGGDSGWLGDTSSSGTSSGTGAYSVTPPLGSGEKLGGSKGEGLVVGSQVQGPSPASLFKSPTYPPAQHLLERGPLSPFRSSSVEQPPLPWAGLPSPLSTQHLSETLSPMFSPFKSHPLASSQQLEGPGGPVSPFRCIFTLRTCVMF